MKNQTGSRAGTASGDFRSPRARHPLRWVLAGIAVVAVLVVAAVAVFIEQPAAPPLTLPAGTASAPSGPTGGTWQVAAGSVVGFRVPDSALGFSNDVVGRTSAVTGTVIVSGDQVTRATVRVVLGGIKVNGKAELQLASSLRTRRFPAATFALTRPVTLGAAFASGTTVTTTAVGELTMNGTAHQVQVTLSGRRDGPVLQAAGSIPVSFPDWSIKLPAGFGFFGSLADHGTAEFRLILRRQ